MTLFQFGIHVSTAVACGAAIGIERQYRRHLAGLRTNALVAGGAALFTQIGLAQGDEGVARISAQIISGIGFLAGGVILREGLKVRGLNTAATLWCTAAAGTLAGIGMIKEALLGSAMIVLANTVLRPIARRVHCIPVESECPTTGILEKLSDWKIETPIAAAGAVLGRES